LKKNYVLIDFENVHVKSLGLLQGEHFRVHVFLGPKNSRLPADLVLAIHEICDRAKYTKLDAPGSNALDFHIAYYLGNLAAADPEGFFHIISKDTGFDPLIQHLKANEILCARSASIEEMPCFKHAALTPAAANGASEAGKPAGAAAQVAVDDLIKIVVDDLNKRKAAKPRKVKTLKSTIHARCGKNVSVATVDAVYAQLVTRGYLKVEGEKLTYDLPGT
jgi:hypothetical protein